MLRVAVVVKFDYISYISYISHISTLGGPHNSRRERFLLEQVQCVLTANLGN